MGDGRKEPYRNDLGSATRSHRPVHLLRLRGCHHGDRQVHIPVLRVHRFGDSTYAPANVCVLDVGLDK